MQPVTHLRLCYSDMMLAMPHIRLGLPIRHFLTQLFKLCNLSTSFQAMFRNVVQLYETDTMIVGWYRGREHTMWVSAHLNIKSVVTALMKSVLQLPDQCILSHQMCCMLRTCPDTQLHHQSAMMDSCIKPLAHLFDTAMICIMTGCAASGWMAAESDLCVCTP